mgnify:CR=1 FL=1
MITYTFWDVVGYVGDAVGTAAEAAKAPIACNMALNHIWGEFPWRQSLAELPPFYLVPGEQVYGPPAVSVPADFLGLERAYHIVRQPNGAATLAKELKCISDIVTTDLPDWPRYIGYEGSTRSFKVGPRPLSNIGAPWHLITGKYKKVPTLIKVSDGTTVNKITANNLHDLYLPFDDLYINVMAEAVKWAFWVLNSDTQRAGGKQMQNGAVSKWGQFAVMDSAIADMAAKEATAIGPPVGGPTEALYSPWIAGW